MSQNKTFTPSDRYFDRRIWRASRTKDGMRSEQAMSNAPIDAPTDAQNVAPNDNHNKMEAQHMVDNHHADEANDKISKPSVNPGTGHIEWFDYAKGICIAFVVMMHSTLGVEKLYGAEGFMHYVVDFAKPFRMPDFFLLSALFLPLAIPRNWSHYLDKKVLHFAYFYTIWVLILIAFKAVGKNEFTASLLGSQIFDAVINPYPALWFIYVLPIFFVVTKILSPLPGWMLFAFAAILQLAVVNTGWHAIDEFAAHYYVFFVAGYLFAPHVFQLAEQASDSVPKTLMLIIAWLITNAALAFGPSPIEGWETLADLPVISILLGLQGAIAIVLIASLISKYASEFAVSRFIRFCGKHSIVLYLSFTIPMAITRLVLAKLNIIPDVGWVSLIVWLVALTTPLAVYAVLRHTPLRYLYERPASFIWPYEAPTKQPPLPARKKLPARNFLSRKISPNKSRGTMYQALVKPTG